MTSSLCRAKANIKNPAQIKMCGIFAVPAISWQQVGDIIMHGRWRGLRFIKRKGAWFYEKNIICKISILNEW